MKKFLLMISGVIIFLIILVMMGLFFLTTGPIDKCLDRGGRWNYDLTECETE